MAREVSGVGSPGVGATGGDRGGEGADAGGATATSSTSVAAFTRAGSGTRGVRKACSNDRRNDSVAASFLAFSLTAFSLDSRRTGSGTATVGVGCGGSAEGPEGPLEGELGFDVVEGDGLRKEERRSRTS